MKTNFHITIPNPCSANWDKMTPDKNGRHCQACNKVVVDFTRMSPGKIKTYFATSKDKTCGHFRKGQLKTHKNRFQKIIVDMYTKAYLNIKTKPIRLATLILLSALLTMLGCNTPTKGEITEEQRHITGDSIAPITIVDSSLPDTSGHD